MSAAMPRGAGWRLDPSVRPEAYDLRFELDLGAWRFEGAERIALRLAEPRDEIVLHAKDLTVDGVVAEVAGEHVQVEASLEPEADALVLRFARAVAAGACTIRLRVAGEIRGDLKGLYRSVRGEERYAVTTLWPAEARRLFACFDEPPFKAPFTLELVTRAGLAAIANTAPRESLDLADGRTLWRFAPTRTLSPYLLAFAVGPFDATEPATTASGTPVRVWVPRGLAGDAVYARDAHVSAIEWLERYTAIPFPFEKGDGVGVSDFPLGAMENPGAITYRLELVAMDPARTSARALKNGVNTIAHELTHMWWGDLVTLAWWDDLWLSESFATFVGNKAVDAMHPEWGIWRDFARGTARGYALDALASTHAIHAEVSDAAAALQRIDAITYQKGAAVLRMLESYLGEDTFRAGVRLYLERSIDATAVAADFWRALDDASGEPVSRVAEAWVSEPGHPLVELRELAPGRLALRQQRAFLDPQAPPSAQRWPIPLVLRGPSGERRVLLEDAATLDVPDGAWLHPNSRAAGFYRYVLAEPLRRRLLANVRALEPVERLAWLDNDWALLRAGTLHARDHAALLQALRGEQDVAVLTVAHEQLQWLAVHVVTPEAHAPFAALVRGLFAPVLERLGWDAPAGEGEDDAELRAIAVRALGELAGDRDVRAEAARRVRAHLDGERQSPDLVGALAAVAARDGDAALARRYVAHMRDASRTDPQDEQRFRGALPSFQDGAAVAVSLDAVDDGTVRDQDLPAVFSDGLRNVAARLAYWNALRERYASRIAPLEGSVRNAIVGSVAQLTPEPLAREADAFLASIREPDSQEVVTRTRESLRLLAAAARRMREELATALA